MPLLEIPDEILKLTGLSAREAIVEFACSLFDAGKLPLWPAAKLAGLSRVEMESALSRAQDRRLSPNIAGLCGGYGSRHGTAEKAILIVISDSSPIRALADIDCLEVVAKLYGDVYIPPAVLDELENPRSELLPLSIRFLPFIHVESPKNPKSVRDLCAALDAGESEAIVLAIEMGADALLMDEKAGRAEAKRRGLTVTGVLGVLVNAKLNGIIPAVKPLLDRLRAETAFFISAQLREEILRQAGETP